jgi:hypothetical protein
MTEFLLLMDRAQRCRSLPQPEKDKAYAMFKRKLSEMTLPVSYEKAIQELCRRMQY